MKAFIIVCVYIYNVIDNSIFGVTYRHTFAFILSWLGALFIKSGSSLNILYSNLPIDIC